MQDDTRPPEEGRGTGGASGTESSPEQQPTAPLPTSSGQHPETRPAGSAPQSWQPEAPGPETPQPPPAQHGVYAPSAAQYYGAPGAPPPPENRPLAPGAYPAYGPATESPRRPGLGAAIAASLITAFIVAAFAGAIAGFAGASLVLQRNGGGLTGPGGTIRVTGDTNEPVAAAAAAALPSVVNIDVSGSQVGSGSGMPQGHPNVPLQGNGSGVAYKKAPGGGTYIITNNHVITGADSIVVTPVNGDQARGTLVGTDPETDIAVVKIDTDLPLMALGDSKKVVVGDMVVAIGSPFGLEHSVSSGVVSALHRSLPPDSADASGTSSLVDVIQTDAAINPGNSGGALVNRQGRLIGIPSAIFSQSGSNDGIGFAIPGNVAVRVADELIASGRVKHPFLGIIGQTVNSQFAAMRKLPVSEGALVLQIVAGSAAQKAGLKQDDVVVQLDDTRIRSMEDLVAAVREAGVGSIVKLKTYRGGKAQTLEMTVGVKPANM